MLIFQSGSDGEDYSPFEQNYKAAKIPNLDISDDESSGVSSTDNSLDNVLKGGLTLFISSFTTGKGKHWKTDSILLKRAQGSSNIDCC